MDYFHLTIKDVLEQKSKIITLLSGSYVYNLSLGGDYAEKLANGKVDQLIQFIESKDTFVLGVKDGKKLVAICWLYVHDFFGEKRLHLNDIVVDSEYQGKGIAKKLLLMAEEDAISVGIFFIDLNVSEHNQKAVSLYTSSGFLTERRLLKKSLNVK